jgi:hypothetical protein
MGGGEREGKRGGVGWGRDNSVGEEEGAKPGLVLDLKKRSIRGRLVCLTEKL